MHNFHNGYSSQITGTITVVDSTPAEIGATFGFSAPTEDRPVHQPGNDEENMERGLRQLIGAAAILGPGLHLLSDIMEWLGRGFSAAQLWVNYLGFVVKPFLMMGLYAVQRPRASWGVLVGALSYGIAFVYFSFTTLYALSEHVADYAALWHKLGALYTVHGALMVGGGVLFAVASLRAAVLPRGAVITFLAGVLLNLAFSLLSVPEGWQTFGSAVRNVGLIGAGTALLLGRTHPAAA